MNSYINERRPLYWALHATYFEYLSENNLNTDNGIIPFNYGQVTEIFMDIGEHYEYYVGSDIKDLTNIAIPKRKLKKELYEIIASHTGQKYDKVHEDSDRDYWMKAPEAKKYGMIDEVLSKK